MSGVEGLIGAGVVELSRDSLAAAVFIAVLLLVVVLVEWNKGCNATPAYSSNCVRI